MANIMKRDATQPATFGSVVDQIFQNNLSRFFDDDYWGFNGSLTKSQVPVNIRETDKTYELEMMAPGLKKEDFKLNIAGDTLTVSIEHSEDNNQENKNEGWLRREYRRQSFTRNFSLDDTVDANKVAAKYENGVLYLSIPKKENAQKVTRTIEIK
jgi:HSP20 family protein